MVVEEKLKNRTEESVGGRITELDFLKGIALIFMVFDHVVYDLGAFFSVDTSVLGVFENGVGHISAVIFMTVCGISVTLGKHNLKHSFRLFCLSSALTAITVIFDSFTNSGSSIYFGILHFLCVAMFLGHYLKRLPVWLLAVMSVGSYALGRYFLTLTVKSSLLFPFGLMSDGFYSADYFPVFPNIAFVILGIIIGKTVYKNKKSLVTFKPKRQPISFLGRHTLILYFLHQPLVLGILYVLSFVFDI